MRIAQMEKVFSYIKGLHATYVLSFGVELGLFRFLTQKPEGLLPEQLAAHLHLHPPYVHYWCETACALELLDYDPSSGYHLAPCMNEILGDRESPFYLGAFPREHLLLARDYAHYPEAFRTGTVYPYQEHDETFLRSVAEATRMLPSMCLEQVLPIWPELCSCLEQGSELLDVGCGSGYALLEFARRYPGLHALGIDIEPLSIQMAEEIVRSSGLIDRIDLKRVDDLSWAAKRAGHFDLVSMFLVLHEIQPDIKDAVIEQCKHVLRPGGLFLIFDEKYPSSPEDLRNSDYTAAVMAQWYEMTWGNRINTEEEIHTLLTRHGFLILEETSLSRFFVVLAKHP